MYDGMQNGFIGHYAVLLTNESRGDVDVLGGDFPHNIATRQTIRYANQIFHLAFVGACETWSNGAGPKFHSRML